jgi:6-phosphofructokinase 2
MPQVEKVVSTAGAGDGVLAGIGYALAYRKPMEEGLKLGFAAAGAVIMTPGTADCQKQDVEKILPTIQLIPYK